MTFTTPQQVIDRARRLGYISVWQYSDAKALEDFNIVYQALCNLIITEVDEDYFSDFLTAEFVSGQNEYTLTDDTNNIDINRVQKVQVKYADALDLKEATLTDKDQLNHPLSYYNWDWRQENTPFYFIFDDSVFVYPSPDTSITDWYQVDVSLTPTDLEIDTPITMLENTHRNLIAEGMLPYIYQQRGLLNEKNNSEASYQEKLNTLIFNMSDRVSTPQEVETPNLSYYD